MDPDGTHNTTRGSLSLRGQQVQRLHGAARLRVTDGIVWLTVHGETDDHFLLPGDRFALARGSNALVQAISGRACVCVRAQPPSWSRRAAATLRAAAQRLAGALT